VNGQDKTLVASNEKEAHRMTPQCIPSVPMTHPCMKN